MWRKRESDGLCFSSLPPAKENEETKNKYNHDQHYDDNLDELTNTMTMPPLTPPPPLPLPSMFRYLFRKGPGKSKKIHPVSPTPPPPLKRWSMRKSQIPPPSPPWCQNIGWPPLSSKSVNFDDEIRALNLRLISNVITTSQLGFSSTLLTNVKI